ncbi:MAG TPA: hypothetical protein VFW12_03915 [Candidatus Limnocylindria bacterium]|nr:hypothetical protein [Candidatus Limnocylindria bacterium]
MAVAAPAASRARSATAPAVRVLAAVGAAGIVVGVPLGLLGRAIMKVGAVAAGPTVVGVHTSAGNVVGDFTLDGTAALVLFSGILPSIGLGLLYLAIRPLLRPHGGWRGAALGVYALALAGPFVLEPGNNDFVRFGPPALNVLMFALLFIVAGVAIAPLVDASLRIASDPSRAQTAVLAAGLLLAVLVLLAMTATGLGVALALATGDHDDLGLSVALISWSAAAGLATRVQALRPFALVALAALLAVGTWQTIGALRVLLALSL